MALKDAHWALGDFDVLVGACGVMEQPIPSTSVLVQNALGLGASGIYSFDVNMTCLSFLNALDLISLGMKAKRFKRAVIFSSDIASAGLNYANPAISALFGDGAAAVCVKSLEDSAHDDDPKAPQILGASLITLGKSMHTAHLRTGGTRIRIEHGYEALKDGAQFYMDPFAIFKAAGKYLPKVIDDCLRPSGLGLEHIDTVICHQASRPALEYVRHLIKDRSPVGKGAHVFDIFNTFGNQIAASLPNALYEAKKQNYLNSGNTVLILGTSAGISLGAMVLRV
jgi:3-oxoacyl-[acyl-carrier-protein] synthase-3